MEDNEGSDVGTVEGSKLCDGFKLGLNDGNKLILGKSLECK